MNLTVYKNNGHKVAEVTSNEVVIKTPQDALDIMANAQYQNANHIILYEKNLTSEFFDLETGLAGEILQKYSNYRMSLVIIGDFEKFESKSLKTFILESNRGKQVAFVSDKQAALEKILS